VEHDPGHRRGVAYWDQATSHRFGQSPERSIQGGANLGDIMKKASIGQTMESLKKQGVDHGNLGSRERLQGQGTGSQGNLEQKDLGTSGQSQGVTGQVHSASLVMKGVSVCRANGVSPAGEALAKDLMVVRKRNPLVGNGGGLHGGGGGGGGRR